MPFRFRRSIRIAPGIRVNLSRSGVSASIGPRGAKLTLGRRPRATIGLPGTGLSYSEPLARRPGAPCNRTRRISVWIALAIISALALLAFVSRR